MKNLWNKTFEATNDVNLPDEIIKVQCSILEEVTNGLIVARISPHSGPIFSYIKDPPFAALRGLVEPKIIEIQENLGDVSEGYFTFEFFITSTSSPNYKYRVMFLRYEIPFYPVIIVLDESIASELSLEQTISCDSQEEFENIVERILGSKKLENVISSLLAIALKEKQPLKLPEDSNQQEPQ